jgi:FixJ family two-component response regulator
LTIKQPNSIVWIVDDDPAVREYLQWLIESVGLGVSLHDSATDFLQRYQDSAPGCLLVDVRMPGPSGFDLQDALAERQIRLPLIMMTAYAEVPMAVRALRNGAFDFVQKPFDGQVLLDRVRQAVEADRRDRSERAEAIEARARLAQLTPRQRAVLDGLVKGKPIKAIAADLGLSPKTVDVHRVRLLERMQATSLSQLFQLVFLAREDPKRRT